MSCKKNAFELYYQKPRNENLLKNLEETRMGLSHCQNFIPLYSTFFSLNDTNYNSINLNQTYSVQSIVYSGSGSEEQEQDDRHFKNISNASVKKRDDDTVVDVPVFFKFSPLLDPIKYLAGNYDTQNEALLHLPELHSLPIPLSINSNAEKSSDKSYEKDKQKDKEKESHYCHSKVLDVNNSAYVDGFFSYLSSQLLHAHDFIHGIDFYGSYLAIQKDFIVNIFDDQEYLMKNEFFKDKNGVLFYYDESECEKFLEWSQERREKKCKQTKSLNSKINILNSVEIVAEELQQEQQPHQEQQPEQPVGNDVLEELALVDVSNSDIFNVDDDDKEEEGGGKKEQDENKNHAIKIGGCDSDDASSSSSCSSRSSHTTNESLYNMSDSDSASQGSDYNSEEEGEEGEGEEEEEEEEILNATIYNFPVEVIALERCKQTLDDLMVEDALSDEEWEAALMQIVMTLATYQKAFAFTHNDLHTNNVMFNETDKKFIYYSFNKKFYKVPTFGRIFKIIDFGRAIYKFNSKLVCSDSFHKSGDAATQYNCEPYYNDKKPLVEPNYSFDLCRLGCSLFDFFIDDIDEVDAECKKSRLVALIVDWITDDNGRNILYKQSGIDRYPDFKLYKMIARTVHNKVPSQQLLKHAVFTQYEIPQKSVKKSMTILDIDAIPSYVLNSSNQQ
jgi:hypothetical protein